MRKRTPVTRLCLIVLLVMSVALSSYGQQRSPTDTVRDFYKAMRERRFREAFGMSIYKPAIEGLSQQEFDDLLPDFEKMAAAIPDKVDLSGEQISGDSATVFVKVKEATADAQAQAEPISLIKVNGAWVVGDRENEAIVKKAGKEFFFTTRIETHQNDVQDLLKRVTLAQTVYSQQHDGKFANLAELIAAGLLPKDLEGTDSTGYSFKVNRAADSKSWYATAEPAQYGRTGKLSFYLDSAGIRSGDAAGQPLVIKN
ncbi:MAG TPA: hypothetical protein VKB46_25055 [Pyrinomonadaceae bacterium]|nr:hypothetical protein [Pyrinomonadaceae bacterium]